VVSRRMWPECGRAGENLIFDNRLARDTILPILAGVYFMGHILMLNNTTGRRNRSGDSVAIHLWVECAC
jgi:hypothetical protein